MNSHQEKSPMSIKLFKQYEFLALDRLIEGKISNIYESFTETNSSRVAYNMIMQTIQEQLEQRN